MTRERVKELLPILQAYAEGKTIEWFDPVCKIWTETNDYCSFSNKQRYRIKPEKSPCGDCIDSGEEIDCGKREKRYRPFKDCNELIDAWIKKIESETEYRFAKTHLQKPSIWVKSKTYGTENCITVFDNYDESIRGSCVFLQDMWLDMNDLFNNFTFLDNSIC